MACSFAPSAERKPPQSPNWALSEPPQSHPPNGHVVSPPQQHSGPASQRELEAKIGPALSHKQMSAATIWRCQVRQLRLVHISTETHITRRNELQHTVG
jgi:hypothetical protein